MRLACRVIGLARFKNRGIPKDDHIPCLFGLLDQNFREDRVVVISGDIRHSRVARSNAFLLKTMGAEVRFVAPASLMPTDVEELGVIPYHRLEPALDGAEAVMMMISRLPSNTSKPMCKLRKRLPKRPKSARNNRGVDYLQS